MRYCSPSVGAFNGNATAKGVKALSGECSGKDYQRPAQSNRRGGRRVPAMRSAGLRAAGDSYFPFGDITARYVSAKGRWLPFCSNITQLCQIAARRPYEAPTACRHPTRPPRRKNTRATSRAHTDRAPRGGGRLLVGYPFTICEDRPRWPATYCV